MFYETSLAFTGSSDITRNNSTSTSSAVKFKLGMGADTGVRLNPRYWVSREGGRS